MAKVLCIGDCCADIIVPYDDLKNSSFGTDVFECGGANANSASGLGKLNVDVAFVGRAGDDKFGQTMKSELRSNGVNVDNFVLDKAMVSTQILVGIDENNDRHPFLYTKDNPSYLQIYESDLNKIDLSDTQYILTNGMMLFDNPAAENITNFLVKAHNFGIKILLDINYRVETINKDKRYIDKVIQISDFLLGSIEDDFLPLTNTTNINDAINCFTNKVLVCRNSLGATVYDNGNSYFSKSYKVDVVDTLGAGDAYNVGFIYGLVNNEPLNICNQYGCGVAAYCISKKGARNAPSENELLQIISNHD